MADHVFWLKQKIRSTKNALTHNETHLRDKLLTAQNTEEITTDP